MKVKNKHRLKNKDIKKLKSEIQLLLCDGFILDSDNVEVGSFEDYSLIFIDGKVIFLRYNDKLLFTLVGLLNRNPEHKFVVVDMGAVKFVTNGADVMSPGVVDADLGIEVGDSVWICDQQHKKPLAVGFALISAEKMINEKSGKAVKIIHFIGDELWNFIKEQ
jgi:PUA domain protein